MRVFVSSARLGPRSLPVIIAALFLLCVSGPAEAERPPGVGVEADWPTPRFNAEGTGFNPYETAISAANVGDLELAWQVEGAGPMGSAPLVVDGVTYAVGQVDSTGTAELYALDAATGDVIWTRTDSGQPIIGFSVQEGKIYAGFLGAHMLRVYDASTGDYLWGVAGPTHTPTVVNGVVYVSDHVHRLFAIDSETGHRLWTARVPLGGYGFGVAVANGVVFAGGSAVDGTSPLYAYDAATGQELWRRPTGGVIEGTPAAAGGVVVVGSTDGFVYALNARTGKIIWTAPTGDAVVSSAAVANGFVYIGSADDRLYAFDARTGDPQWTAVTGGNITTIQAPAVANGVVYIGSSDHKEYAFDALTGEELWSFQTGSVMRMQAIVNGSLYMTSVDGSVYAFGLPVE